jgi:hypothetical protein
MVLGAAANVLWSAPDADVRTLRYGMVLDESVPIACSCWSTKQPVLCSWITALMCTNTVP